MKRPFKDTVRAHFERQSLSSDQFEKLEALMGQRDSTGTTLRRSVPRAIGWMAGIAATVVIAIGVLILVQGVDSASMTERIAMEVARNQIKLKPLDISTSSFSEVRAYFTDLDFVPTRSSLLKNADFELIGGRYCSIQSVPAAQLRVKLPTSEGTQTLYQTAYRKDVFGPLPVIEDGDVPVTINAKGMRISVWVEKGLLFSLTEENWEESVIAPK
jgi:hypothetical protein